MRSGRKKKVAPEGEGIDTARVPVVGEIWKRNNTTHKHTHVCILSVTWTCQERGWGKVKMFGVNLKDGKPIRPSTSKKSSLQLKGIVPQLNFHSQVSPTDLPIVDPGLLPIE